jgi:hypothetical protein
VKTWGRAVLSAFWFATVMAAAQIGAATIFGALKLDGTLNDDAWLGRLTLVLWFAISSAIAGAYAGGRTATSGIRMSAAFAGGFGGAAGACVVLYPLRTVVIEQGDPRLLAGIALGFAAITSFILAFAFLAARSLAWNAAVVALIVWALIAMAVAGKAGEVRLGQFDTSGMSGSFVTAVRLWGLPAVIALVSFLIALIARARGHHRGAIAVSGMAGSATIALAYVLAGPGSSDSQKSPWISALIGVAAGLVASVVVALPPRRTPTDAFDYSTTSTSPWSSSSWPSSSSSSSSSSSADSAFPLPATDIPSRRRSYGESL